MVRHPLRVLDLFSGIGGFSLGLERAGFKTVAFCEIDAEARKVLRKNWEHIPIYEDVTTLTANQLAYDGVEVDVICGGFPCQNISNSGDKTGIVGERSGLWSEYLRLIKELLPKYVIIENVSALRNRGLTLVLQNLHEVGYDAEWHCIPASAVGAPHQRDRLWIVAYPKCVGSQGQGQLIKSLHTTKDSFEEASGLVDAFYEERLPYVCRRHDGIPSSSHRIKQLGNAVVPQIVEQIGNQILIKELIDGT